MLPGAGWEGGCRNSIPLPASFPRNVMKQKLETLIKHGQPMVSCSLNLPQSIEQCNIAMTKQRKRLETSEQSTAEWACLEEGASGLAEAAEARNGWPYWPYWPLKMEGLVWFSY